MMIRHAGSPMERREEVGPPPHTFLSVARRLAVASRGEDSRQLFFSYASKVLQFSDYRAPLQCHSHAKMWVATRSRNRRSWVTTTAQPRNVGAFSSRERLDVEVVGRLIQQEEVATLLEVRPGSDGCAHPLDGHPAGFKLRPMKPRRNVGARRHFAWMKSRPVEQPPRACPGRCRDWSAVADLDGLADRQLAAVERLGLDDRLGRGEVLPTPFGPMTPTMPVTRQREGQTIDERAVPALCRSRFASVAALQARARRNLNFLEVQLAGARARIPS